MNEFAKRLWKIKKPADKINREEFFGCVNGMFDRIPNFLKTVEKIIYDNINK